MKTVEGGASPAIKASPKPIVTNKLPKAFCTPILKQAREEIREGNARHPSRNQREAAQQGEFKQMNQLLSPIKLTPNQRKVMKTSLSRIESAIFKDGNNASFDRPSNRISLKALSYSGIHAQDIITIAIVANSARGGCLKKVLHSPTVKVFAVKEVPIGTREIRQGLYDWVAKWEKLQKHSVNLVQLHTTFWNTPEGCMSFVLEHISGYSLLTLTEQLSVSIPEAVLSRIAKCVLLALQAIHEKGEVHGGISPSQILLGRDGEVKLSLGLLARTERELKEKTMRGDLKDLGSALLLGAAGGMEWGDTEETRATDCCFLHGQGKHSPLRTSLSLQDFICSLLNSSDASCDSMLRHPWLAQQSYPGPSLDLADLCHINAYLPVASSPVTSSAAQLQLERICRALHVLGDGNRTKRSAVVRNDVSQLAEELGLEVGFVWQKISKVL